jgi:hypothetical protein
MKHEYSILCHTILTLIFQVKAKEQEFTYNLRLQICYHRMHSSR